jgi:HDOD domain-containing protein
MPHVLYRSADNAIRSRQNPGSGYADPSWAPNSSSVVRVQSGAGPNNAFPDVASRLSDLLSQTATDLGQISDAIRACPELELLLLQTSDSLALSLGTHVASIEEAVVILGKDQLNFLVRSWLGSRPNRT